MSRLSDILVVALMAVLAAWSVMQVATATTMSPETSAMMAAESGAMDMDNCPECDTGEEGKVDRLCHLVCVSPTLADLVVIQMFGSALGVTSHVLKIERQPVGRTDPPDPYPPRSVLLI